MKVCFSDKAYNLIYLHRLFAAFPFAANATFALAWLVHHGLPLYGVFLYIGLGFAVSGVTAPFGYRLARHAGLAGAILVSGVLFCAGGWLVAQAETSLFLAFLSLVFINMAYGIYYPISDVLEALYVKDDSVRGRQFHLGAGMDTCGSACGAFAGPFLIQHFGYEGMVLAVFAAYVLSVVPLACLPSKNLFQQGFSLRTFGRFLCSDDYRPYVLPIAGIQLAIILFYSLPLYIFLVLGQDFNILGVVVAAATVLQFCLLNLFGWLADKYNRTHISGLVLGVNALTIAGFLLLPLTVISATLLDSFHQLSWRLYESSFVTRLHSHVHDRFSDLLLFGAAWQTTLCFFEFWTLLIFAAIAFFFGDAIFTCVFLMAVLGLYIGHKTMPAR